MVLAFKDRVLWLLSGGPTDSSGQTLVEYSLILAFIATMIVALGVVVGGTGGLLDDIRTSLQSALG